MSGLFDRPGGAIPDPLQRARALYNAPLHVHSVAALAQNTAFAFLRAEDNHNGRFLSRAFAWGYRGATADVLIALFLSQKTPSAFSAIDAGHLLDVSTCSIFTVNAGAIDNLQAVLRYEPRVPRFIPPGFGVYAISPTALSGTVLSAEFFFDNEQLGR